MKKGSKQVRQPEKHYKNLEDLANQAPKDLNWDQAYTILEDGSHMSLSLTPEQMVEQMTKARQKTTKP